MPSPPGISAIKLETYYNTKRPNIPFSEVYKTGAVTEKFYYVIIYGGEINSFNAAQNSAELKDKAIDRYIEHYAPRFYPFVVGSQTSSQQTTLGSIYTSLRTDIEASLAALNLRKSSVPPPLIPGEPPIFNQSRILFVTSALLEDAGGGDVSAGLQAFYVDMGMDTTVAATTSIKLSTLPAEQTTFSSFLSSLNQQARNFPGQLELNLNFNTLQGGVEKILQIIIKQLTKFMDFRGINESFATTDRLVIDFNGDNQILEIRVYLEALDENTGSPLITGFITNSKYNNYFKDPLTLSTLRNYETINENIQQGSQLGEQSSFLGFMENVFGSSPDGGNLVNFSGPHTPDNALGPYNNIFANRESEDLVDIADINKIRKIFSTFKTSEEIQKIDRYVNDPKVRKMALQSEKAKRINAAIAITEVIDKALKFEFPMAGLNDTKEGRAINQILNQFGIQELAKEALICLTAGATLSLSRISSAVKQELTTMSSSPLYTAPSKPRNIMERPSLGDFKVYFSITGDPPIGKQILDIILKALANGAFEIIKAIADMIKFNCGEIFDADIGGLDAGTALSAAIPAAELNIPNLEGILDDLAGQNGIPGGTGGGGIYDYLSDVSAILSPDELCKLFNSSADVTQDTLDKIVEFNSIYPHGTISADMITYNAILNFFSELAQYIDTTSLCNEYIESVAERLKDCVICLDEGALAQSAAIEELSQIIENGIQVEIVEPDFLCPENPNYITNPVAETIVPNLFYTLIETIQLQVGASIEGVRTSMLVPELSANLNADLSGSMAAAGLAMPPYGDAQQGEGFDPEVLENIADVFGKISETLQNMDDPNVCPDLDLSKIPILQQILDTAADVSSVVQVGLDAAAEAGAEINDKLQSLQDASLGAGIGVANMFTTYKFPKAYRDRFAEAVGPMQFDYNSTLHRWRGLPIATSADWSSTSATPPRYEIQSAKSYFNTSTDDFQVTYLKFNFDEDAAKEAVVRFPAFSRGSPRVRLTLSSQAAGSFGDANLDGIYDFTPSSSNIVPPAFGRDLNPLVARFIDRLPTSYIDSSGVLQPMEGPFQPGQAPGVLFPQLFMVTLKKLFNYILQKGAFSEYTISRLNFFKDNEGCSGANVGDLLDAEGIVDQMQNEFKLAVCQDAKKSAKAKIKDTMRYGVVNLLIQAYFVEFIMSNITVLSAFSLSSSLQGKVRIEPFLIDGIADSFIEFANNLPPVASVDSGVTLEKVIRAYFERRIARDASISVGGIVSPSGDVNIDIVPEENPETIINAISLNQLVKFLVEERIYHVWGDGRSTIGAVENILDPLGNKPAVEDIFIKDILGVWPKAAATGAVVASPDASNGCLFIGRSITYTDSATNDRVVEPVTLTIARLEVGVFSYSTWEATRTDPKKSYTLFYRIPRGTGNRHVGGTGYTAGDGGAGLDPLDVSTTWVPIVNYEWEDYSGNTVADLVNFARGEVPHSLSDTQVASWFASNDEAQQFIDQVLNPSLMYTIPLLYNMNLSNKYFSGVAAAFLTTKNAIVNLLNIINNSDQRPTINPPTVANRLNAEAANGGPDMAGLMREIILKFLRETPIQILKGLVEMIDPHVAISKMIRDITGIGFAKASDAISIGLDVAPANPLDPGGPSMSDAGVTGEDILALAFCGLNMANSELSSGLGDGSYEGPLLGPKFTLDGIDFTGTVAGMFMSPPSPLGIIYLLIMMLQNLLESIPPEESDPDSNLLPEPAENGPC